MSNSIEARTSTRRRSPHSTKSKVLGAACAAALVAVAFSSYAVGSGREQRTNVLVGDFYVGAEQATGDIDGWVYGFTDSVSWIDPDGSFHQSGWPTCLDTVGTTERVSFGELPATGPQGSSWRQVVWVDCRGAIRR